MADFDDILNSSGGNWTLCLLDTGTFIGLINRYCVNGKSISDFETGTGMNVAQVTSQ
jgi:hypothetical protein